MKAKMSDVCIIAKCTVRRREVKVLVAMKYWIPIDAVEVVHCIRELKFETFVLTSF